MSNVTAASPESTKARKRLTPQRITIFALLGVVLVALFATSVYFFIQYQNSQKLLKDPKEAAKEDTKVLLAKVGMVMALPSDEVPTIATVSDKSKLSEQAFFLKAENGDKILIYSNARRAILYRPSLNKIIDVTSVTINGPELGETTTPAPSGAVSPAPAVAQATVRIALYNGTSTNGLTTKVEASLMSLSSIKSTVVAKANATGDYTESVVIDLTGKNKASATQLASFVKGKVVSLPKDEAKPDNADILIILGTSYTSL